MTWIRDRVGLPRLVQLANSETPLSPADLERVFGGSLASLAAAWNQVALASFKALPDGQAQVRAYRNETPIRYFPVCGPEVFGKTSP